MLYLNNANLGKNQTIEKLSQKCATNNSTIEEYKVKLADLKQ